MNRQYYYHDGNNQIGPIGIDQLKKVDLIKPDTWVWTEGLDDWKSAKNFEELKILFDYEKMSDPEVERLAKQRDNDALYEMVWRHQILAGKYGGDLYNPRTARVWQDIWLEQAAKAEHIVAMDEYARSLVNHIDGTRVMTPEGYKKAESYFRKLSNAFDNGKLLSGDELKTGIRAKLWLGIILCEGDWDIKRNVGEGLGLIKDAKDSTNDFKDFGFYTLSRLGRLYGLGYAQIYEEPSRYDLKVAIEYLERAKAHSKSNNSEKIDKKILENDENLLANFKKLFDGIKQQEKNITAISDDERHKIWLEQQQTYNDSAKEKRRRKTMKLLDEEQQWLDAYKKEFERLNKCLAMDGWFMY